MKKPTLTIKADKKGEALGDLYGIFFEDLNHAADGGLYAEMVQNRSFEFDSIDSADYHSLYAWTDNKGIPLTPRLLELRVLNDYPLNLNNPHYLKLDCNDELEIQNIGFNQGMYIETGKAYNFSFFAKNLSLPKKVKVSLKDIDGKVYSEDTLEIDSREWEKYELCLNVKGTTNKGRLSLTFEAGANLAVDMISLFPKETFRGRKNGMRKDIAEFIQAMKPKFMRFPGGCLVHDGSLNSGDRDSMYRWKNTIGLIEERASKRNNWKYNQTLGLGFYEYFLFCKDIKAEPIPVVPGGVDPHHKKVVPLEELDEWVQDALDLIEFANGSPETIWGKVRVEMGHPETFNMKYIAIGNEEVGQEFYDNYVYFHKAIRETYPEIKIINSGSPFSAGSEFERSWKSSRENGSDLVDEHYYHNTDWMLAHHHRYDSYDIEGPKVFLGEYSSWGNAWLNAIVEASYMIGLERNADKVDLACYAPMLANLDYVNWKPDMIWFNQETVYGSMNYYVQKLFMNFQGTRNIGWIAEGLPEPEVSQETATRGIIGFAGDHADISYWNMTVTDNLTNEKKTLPDGVISGNESIDLYETSSTDYTIRFSFEKMGGQPKKGLRLNFGQKDSNNYLSWLLGGWENQDSIIRFVSQSKMSDLTQTKWQVESKRIYVCELKVKNNRIVACIDGKVINDTTILPIIEKPLYINVVEDEESNRIICKLVNIKGDMTIDLKVGGDKAIIHKLKAEDDSFNSLENPNNFEEYKKEVSITDEKLTLDIEKSSILFVEVPK